MTCMKHISLLLGFILPLFPKHLSKVLFYALDACFNPYSPLNDLIYIPFGTKCFNHGGGGTYMVSVKTVI